MRTSPDGRLQHPQRIQCEVDRVVHLVRDACCEFADRSQSLRLDQRHLGLAQVFERAFERGVLLGQFDLQRTQPHQRARARHQLARVEGLGDVVVGTEFQAMDLHLALGLRGDEHHRHALELGVRLDRLAEFGAGHLGHHHVRDHERRCALAHEVERLASIARSAHAELTTQQVDQQPSHVGVVLRHHQLGQHCAARGGTAQGAVGIAVRPRAARPCAPSPASGSDRCA